MVINWNRTKERNKHGANLCRYDRRTEIEVAKNEMVVAKSAVTAEVLTFNLAY